ncbi:hypothetical protein A4V08_37055 [Lachnoclostridium sp. YL32]|nr:hypothetical protein A4V08_37055 [Lachnoclostridium sp. YL32]
MGVQLKQSRILDFCRTILNHPNLLLIRKWSLRIWKMIESFCSNLSMKKKRFIISINPSEFLEPVLNF